MIQLRAKSVGLGFLLLQRLLDEVDRCVLFPDIQCELDELFAEKEGGFVAAVRWHASCDNGVHVPMNIRKMQSFKSTIV